MAPVQWGNAFWHDPQVLGKRLLFLCLFCMVLLARRDSIWWFVERLMDWGDEASPCPLCRAEAAPPPPAGAMF